MPTVSTRSTTLRRAGSIDSSGRSRPIARAHSVRLGVDRQAGPDQLEVLAARTQLGRRERLPLIVHLVGDGGALLASLRRHTSSVMLHRCSGRPSRF